jgi:hypothetical protein
MSQNANSASHGYQFPKDILPGKDTLVLDDGTRVRVDASYALSEDRWVVEGDGQMIQMDPNVRVRVQRPV